MIRIAMAGNANFHLFNKLPAETIPDAINIHAATEGKNKYRSVTGFIKDKTCVGKKVKNIQ